jgi:hypothetical protein
LERFTDDEVQVEGNLDDVDDEVQTEGNLGDVDDEVQTKGKLGDVDGGVWVEKTPRTNFDRNSTSAPTRCTTSVAWRQVTHQINPVLNLEVLVLNLEALYSTSKN